jgi:hypothetical protein
MFTIILLLFPIFILWLAFGLVLDGELSPKDGCILAVKAMFDWDDTQFRETFAKELFLE